MEDVQNAVEQEQAKVALDPEFVEQICSALEGRAAFLDMMAWFYFKPLTQEQIENFANMDWSAYTGLNDLFDDGINDMTRFLRKRHTGTRQQLAVDFTASWGSTNSFKGMYAAPYESVFTSEEGIMYQESYHEVYQIYKRMGFARAEGYDYPDDHLTFMLEFLVVMSRRAQEFLREGDAAAALNLLKISREFEEQHILSWIEPFQELTSKLIHTRFYRGVMKVSKGFLLFDQDVMRELSEAIASAAGLEVPEGMSVVNEAEETETSASPSEE